MKPLKQRQREAEDRRAKNHNGHLDYLREQYLDGRLSREDMEAEARADFIAAFDRPSGHSDDGIARIIIVAAVVGVIGVAVYAMISI